MKLIHSIAAAGVISFVSAFPTFPWGAPAFPSSSWDETTLRFLTYNVRWDSQPNSITVKQTLDSLPKGLPDQPSPYYNNPREQPWSTRRIGVLNDVLFPGVDIFGVQEMVKRQVDDMQELLGDDWSHIGVGRDDGKEAGEYSAIFFQKKAVQLLSWDTFWLSDTPFEPSKYPGAGSFRACTRAQFRSASGIFTLLNSHLDDQSDAQRKLAASLMLHRAKYEAIKTRRPVIMTGDFNSLTTGDNSGAYQITTGILPPVTINDTFAAKYSWNPKEEIDFVLRDVKADAPPVSRSGNFATFTGFKDVNDPSSFSRIDYIFGGSNGGWTPKSYHVGNTIYDNGVWNSDHRPVYSDITIKR